MFVFLILILILFIIFSNISSSNQYLRSYLLPTITLLSFIATIFFWIFLFIDGEEFFVVGTMISTAVYFVCLNILFSTEFFKVAKTKGYHNKKFFWYSVLFGMIGFLLIIALPAKTKEENTKIDAFDESMID